MLNKPIRADLKTFIDTLNQRGLFVFNKLDLTRLFGWTDTAVTFLLHRYAKKGIVTPLKRDLFALSGVTASDFYIANRLREPSYVSLESALSFHHVIPEVVYAVTSVTTRTTRTYEALNRTFRYHHLKRVAYVGYEPIDQGGLTVLMATPEKALADYCYLVTKGLKRPLDTDRLRLDRLDVSRLRQYVALYRSFRLTKMVNDLTEL